MDQPRLRINDEEVGLRHLGNGLYEPKSALVFKKVIEENYKPPKSHLFSRLIPLSKEKPKRYHKIESFCFVATENIKEEAELLLKSLRQFHDQPVYVICDKATRVHLAKQGLSDNVTFRILAEQEHLDKINEEIFKSHKCIANKIHSAPCIFKKMDVMDFALQHHANTFFLDADIIVLDNLQEYFEAKVILSPHYYPSDKEHKGFEFGFYNAGYIFCANKGFPKFWKHVYLNDSSFFEQECMNRISDRYNIQTFGEEHNVGFWRENELPKKAKSIHAHITKGVDKGRGKELLVLNTKIKDYAISQAEKYQPKISSDIKKYYNPDAPKKLAFIHFGKCAGVYVQHYLRRTVMPDIKHYNSWWDFGANNKRNLERDWTKEELLEIAIADTETGLAHNHQINWCKETVKSFNDNGWLTFMFIRDPRNILCSLYFWSQRQYRRWKPEELHGGLRGPLKDEITKMSGQDDPYQVSIDTFIKFLIMDKEARHLWMLPDYINEIEYVAEFNDENFGNFLLEYFGHDYIPQRKRNTSPSKGYEFYCQTGEISKETQNLIENSLEILEYKKWLTCNNK